MKREEMIYYIDMYLCEEFFFGSPKDHNGAWDSYETAKRILDVVEKHGMIPPFNVKYFDVDYFSELDNHFWDENLRTDDLDYSVCSNQETSPPVMSDDLENALKEIINLKKKIISLEAAITRLEPLAEKYQKICDEVKKDICNNCYDDAW